MNSASPDRHAAGFLDVAPDPLRYDGHTSDPMEAAGMIAGLTPPNKRVLDVGCGTGSLSRLLMDMRGARLVGIEPDLQRATTARTRGIDARHGFFDEAAVQNLGKFDVVVFADVLEHLPDPASALQLTRQVLEPDGVVIASVPNIAHWSVRLELLCGRFDYQSCGIMDATHLRWFTERSLRALFESSGYRVEAVQQTAGVGGSVYHEYFFWRWFRPRRCRIPLIRWLAKTLPRLFGYQHVVRAYLK
jgi:methionine biosynthesis protein MetW